MRVETPRAPGTRLSGFGCGTAILAGSIVILVVSLTSIALFLLSPGGDEAVASLIRAQPGSMRWDHNQRLNVLLLGVDRHSSRGAPARALFVVSFDPRARTIHTLAIPPDLWVALPGFGPGRVADAYADGGPGLALRMVQDIAHVPIPYYAVVDLDAFKRIVDALGGVNVSMPTVLSGSSSSMPVGNLEMNGLAHDRRHLSGGAALQFMRAGTAGAEGEIVQMDREQEVLFALKRAALQPQSFVRIPSLIATLGGSVPTNFPYDQLPELARGLASVPSSGTRGASLDYTNRSVSDYSSDGEHVLLPDWQHISMVTQTILADPGLRQSHGVVVWNGSGVDGQAASLNDWLRQAGISVVSFSSAPHEYERTSVMLSSAASPHDRYTARAVATLLRAPLISQRGHHGARIAVIIGHDFQDPSPE